MKKFNLNREILGFTMCVRDKPIGLSLINIISNLKFLPVPPLTNPAKGLFFSISANGGAHVHMVKLKSPVLHH